MAFVPALQLTAGTLQSRSDVTSRRGALRSAAVSRRATVARRAAPTMILGKTIAETLQLDKKNKTLLALAAAAGIDINSVSGTLFAPTEAAFARLPAGAAEWLCERPDILRIVILRHVAPDTLTTPKLAGVGYLDNVYGGPLSYEGLGPIVKVGGQRVIVESSNRECSNGIIHSIEGVILPPGVSIPAFELPTTAPAVGASMVFSANPSVPSSRSQIRARGACDPSTVGGRRAMGLMRQLPFYMYGPPYNAPKQEDYEPISIAKPDVSFVDYQIFPPGSVVVVPDQVSAAKLNPVSGFSKYIGQVSRVKEGDAESEYSRLDS